MTSLETNPSPLAALRTASLTLLFSSQSHPIGFPTLHLTPTTSLASHLSEKEIHLLKLYDKLQELSFQRCLLEASVSLPKGGEYIESDEELQKKLDEARGNRKLKEAVTESMLIAKPILRAVHPAPQTARGGEDVLAKRERSLLPMVIQRDKLSLATANISTMTLNANAATTALARAHKAVLERNIELAKQLLELEKKREEEREKGRGEEYRKEMEKWKVTKGRWEVVRQVAQAVVVGSGVDWSRDEELREWVVGWGDE